MMPRRTTRAGDMTRTEARIRNRALEEAAKAAEEYGEVTFEVCADNILMDPLLHGEPWTEENIKRSADCQVQSTIHSSGFHAANHIAENIRALKTKDRTQ
jgi:hypothetical protein